MSDKRRRQQQRRQRRKSEGRTRSTGMPGGARSPETHAADRELSELVMRMVDPLIGARTELDQRAARDGGSAIRDLDLAEARARIDAALYMLDHTYEPLVSEDVRPLRALIEARIAQLPGGLEPPDAHEVAAEERDALLIEFLASPEGQRWDGDEDAEDVVGAAIEFGSDYNHGGPLRWNPVGVELFMTSWLARKFARESEFFSRVPEVLPDWVRYAGRRRGVPAEQLREALAAVELYREEMFAATNDPGAWDPAKMFAVAAQQAGLSLSDPEAIERFVERYNDRLAA